MATPTMGNQSSKAPWGDVTAEEAASTSPAKVNGWENGHVEGGRPHPVNGTEEEAGATGDAIELEPPSQGSEVLIHLTALIMDLLKTLGRLNYVKQYQVYGLMNLDSFASSLHIMDDSLMVYFL
ncbi:hypothetical protein E2I00_014876 [Balaenoptera physalus]|uniref:Uncharacterized protein n=1 Tax=Balaenoptera physalus TaxID=9770 RepID=A0A643C064_BALPH|nr:hypothetical protein E2I00_014876 [Balaenoptera physalus]